MGREPKTSELEQRGCDRFRVNVAVKVHLSDAGQASSCHGTGTNISVGGMQLVISKDFVVGQLITIELRLPYHRRTLKLRAVVRNRVSFKYGVEFIDLSDRDRDAIVQNCRVLSLLQ
jgi:hypothetical protein